MKKFDLFLLILACGLISFGYYFSKHFKSDSDLEIKNQSSQSVGDGASVRTPSQTLDKNYNVIQHNSEASKKNAEDIATTKEYVEKYKYFQKCIVSQDCDFPQDDPRSYELAIFSEMNEHLKNIDVLPLILKEKVLMSAARYSDGFVKETILNKIMTDKIYSVQWMHVVLDEYIGEHNARLIPEAIKYLKEFSTEDQHLLIHQKIFAEIANGSPKVANALAENLNVLLDEKSYTYYKSQLSKLEEGPIRSSLNRELRDFELHSSAG